MKNKKRSAHARRIFLGSVIFFLAFVSYLWANPPEDIEFNYDAKEKVLRVSVKHMTKKPHDDYIRKLTVSKNEEASQEFLFAFQPSPLGVEKNIPMEAQAGDKIYAKALCSKGGAKEITWQVPY
jgi:hypothetical protein